jgi:uncharacterized protein (TIGR03435 family)
MVFRRIAAVAFIFFGARGIVAQSTANPPAFTGATIKPSSPYASGRSFRTAGGHFVVDNHTLQECTGMAYNLPSGLVSGGQGWTESTRYDMVADLPPTQGAAPLSVMQSIPMFQTLLADRFKLQFHREQKLLAVYNLVVEPNTLKITESTAGPAALPSLFIQDSPPPRTSTLPARNASIAQFASLIERVVADRPVIDKTGLFGRYNFDLQWSPDAPSGKPDIFTALQQLGLALVPAETLVDTVVVDYAEQPGEN